MTFLPPSPKPGPKVGFKQELSNHPFVHFSEMRARYPDGTGGTSSVLSVYDVVSSSSPATAGMGTRLIT